ncbi:MAG: hypothetical protein ABFE01_16430, partial [Phycisphaerales bacterium]
MNRREFLSAGGAVLLGTAKVFAEDTSTGIRWQRRGDSGLFQSVTVDGRPLVWPEDGVGLFDGFCRTMEDGSLGREIVFDSGRPSGECGPISITLEHRLRSFVGTKEDLLEATLTLKARSDRACEVFCGFLTGVRPCRNAGDQQIYVPISASGLRDPEDDKRKRLKDCHQTVGSEGFLCHYLEPQASDPRQTTTRASLLAPVVDVFADGGPCHIALFSSSMEPVLFQALQGPASKAWRVARRVKLEPGETHVFTAFLLLHRGDATDAWKAFHQFGHKEDFPLLAWPREVRVHYFDFLSAATADGPRGGGYDLDLKRFGEFHVGMATQHGYYLSYGDFIHPDRKEWKAMPTDAAGPVAMSIEKIKARVDATRKAGVHPAIYMHYTILDEGSPLFESMRDSILVDAAGNPTPFGWEGPDVIKKTWRMSPTSAQWRDHLVQQARWIMELFNPDAIVLDETFTASGYDYHKEHGGPLSRGGIELMRRLREAVRSFGPDKALFASDCSMGNLCLWGDGESGDHCYDRLLGHELYRKPPIRYMAALGEKA